MFIISALMKKVKNPFYDGCHKVFRSNPVRFLALERNSLLLQMQANSDLLIPLWYTLKATIAPAGYKCSNREDKNGINRHLDAM